MEGGGDRAKGSGRDWMHGDRTAGDPALQQGDARMHAWIWAKLECAMGSAGSTLSVSQPG